jgi:hypothetical protein
VQEHGGEIKLEESAPGKTVFTIVLYKKALYALDRLHEADAAAHVMPVQAERSCEVELASSQERL